ncbi:hypothetical protein AB6F62_20335 [Providencia huaxiensis]|uniref:hypothetical protein n=1 Tax=Providencia huaxiensis TaxID=2027290 RepID=UPI0034DD63A2
MPELAEIFNFIIAYQKQITAIIGVLLAILLSRHMLKVHSFFICKEDDKPISSITKKIFQPSKKDKLIHSLLKERIAFECSDSTYYCVDIYSNYSLYKYNKLIPEVVSKLSHDKLTKFRELWDRFRELKLKHSAAKDLILVIDEMIDLLKS